MYAAHVRSQRLTFDVECVWRRNMVIRDRETGSLWQHATGEAVAGPLKGERLTVLSGELITWAGWKQAHPDTEAALEPEDWTGLIPKARVKRVLEKVTSVATIPGKSVPDKRLPSHEMIIGIVVGDLARAYPLSELRRLGSVCETINGRQIEVIFDEEHDVVRASVDGAGAVPQRTWWTGWYEFHPGTTIYGDVPNDS
ncbi:MAG: DUF3179 domain-containing protein [Caldilineae bacterium]|nr:DUF3179 domain-containing protein [Caldilineae bacterium]